MISSAIPRSTPRFVPIVKFPRMTSVLAITLSFAVSSLAAEKDAPRTSAQVRVDPRVELVSIIFRLAGNNEYNQGQVQSYIKDVESHFGPFRSHPVVRLAKRLRQSAGVCFDAPMSLAVCLTDTEKLETKTPLEPWPEGLDRRWNAKSVTAFLDAARQFVRDTSFNEFFEKHRPLYKVAESRMQAILDKEAHLEWFEEFFGERPAAKFEVALAMLNGGSCYGPHARTAHGTEELYCILGVWQTDAEGQPQFVGKDVLPTIVHEFCHSYANGFVYRHSADLQAAGDKLFSPVASAMKAQAYGSGETLLCESMVRACGVRYTLKYAGESAAKKQIAREISCQFRWTGDLSKVLDEYETHRDKYPTLDAFSGPLIKFFVDYSEKFAKQQKIADALRPKIISIIPANGDENVDPDLKAIKVVFDRPMADKSWSLVGGGPHFPEIAGKCAFDSKRTTWTCPIKLKPDWTYRFMLNARPNFMAFHSEKGIPLEPVTVSFKTGKKREDKPKD